MAETRQFADSEAAGRAAPSPIQVDKKTSAPSLPTPEVDSTSLIDSILKASPALGFDDPAAAPLINHAQEVEKLADENKTLDAKLAELQRRLEKAEERRKAVEGQR